MALCRVGVGEGSIAERRAPLIGCPCHELRQIAEAAGVPVAPINTVGQALHNPLVKARGMQLELGGVPMLGSPLNLSLTPVSYREPPPLLGQHSDEIARSVGTDPAALRAAGAIR